MTQRAAFIATVSRLMDEDDRIILLLCDIGVYGFRRLFQKHPKRCHNTGVTECGTVGMAAGLAASGYYPIVSTIDSFLMRRAYEFIRLDFRETGLAGLFVGVGGQREYRKLGPTHMLPEQAAHHGVSFPQLCAWMVENAACRA